MTADLQAPRGDPVGADANVPRSHVTALLLRWSGGDESALDHLVPLVYQELKQLARRHLHRERDGHTLQGTALVHETFMRLVNERGVQMESRAQFFAWASHLMRRILVNHARDRRAGKRGGGMQIASLEALQEELGEVPERIDSDDPLLDLAALDEALHRIAEFDPRKAAVVELRFFGGLSVEETAQTLSISPATVVREWGSARAWLLHQLGKTPR